MKSVTSKQAEYAHSKCKNKGVMGKEQVYKCENDDIP